MLLSTCFISKFIMMTNMSSELMCYHNLEKGIIFHLLAIRAEQVIFSFNVWIHKDKQ